MGCGLNSAPGLDYIGLFKFFNGVFIIFVGHIASNDRITVIDEFRWKRREVVAGCFKMLAQFRIACTLGKVGMMQYDAVFSWS
jgi:hypothetical protein